MRTLILASAAGLVAIVAQSANAADMPAQVYTRAPAVRVAAPLATWGSLYIGGQVGYQWGSNRQDEFVPLTGVGTPGGVFSWDSDGVVGGAHIGYNLPVGMGWLIGMEADLEISDVKGNFPAGPRGGVLFNQEWQGSVRARLGYYTGPVLFYATGGIAFSELQTRHTNAAGVSLPGDQYGSTEYGWTLGGGVEWMFAPAWSIRGEYRYTDYGHYGTDIRPASFPALSYDQRVDFHTVRGGLTWHFFRN